MKTHSQPAACRQRFRQYFPTLLIVALALVALGYLWREIKQEHEDNLRARFLTETVRIGTRIDQRMDTYVQILRGAAGLFAASHSVERDEWRHYVDSQELGRGFHGIQGVGFAQYLRPGQLAAHERAVRREGFPDYAVKPAGARAEYSSIVFLEPFSGRNLRAFGYDMLSEPVRRAAMAQARDTGAAVFSGKVTLVQETNTDVQAGILAYLPVYANGTSPRTVEQRRAALIGWAYSPYRMNDLMAGILGEELRFIRLEIFDGDGTRPEALLYDSRPEAAPVPGLEEMNRIELEGRTWTLRYRALPGFAAAIGHEPPWIELTSVLVVALMLFFSAWLLVNTRRRAEGIAARLTASLRESERQLVEAQAAAGFGSWHVVFGADEAHDIWTISDELRRMYGHSDAAAIGTQTGFVAMPAADEALTRRYWAAAKRGEGQTEWEHRIIVNGAIRWMHVVANVTFDEQGRAIEANGTNQDITERKLAEIKLLESEARQRTIIESEPECIKIVDAQGRLKQMNPAGLAMIEADSLEQVAGQPVINVIAPEYRDAFMAMHRRVIGGESALLEYEVVGIKGGRRWLETHAVPMREHGETVHLAVTRDITERKRAEEALRESEFRWKFAIEGSGDGLWDWNITGGTVFFSRRWKEMLGFAEDEIGDGLGEWEGRIHPGDKAATLATVQDYLDGKTEIYISEHRVRCKDGGYKWILDRGIVVARDETGKPLRMIGTHADISARKRDEQALAEAEHHFRSLANGVSTLIWMSGPDKLCHYFNEPWLKFTGRTLEQELGNGWAEGVHPGDFERCLKIYVDAFDRREAFSMDYRLRHADGGYRWIRDDGKPNYGMRGEFLGYIGACTDITEAKRAETRLRELNKDFVSFLENTSDFIYFKDGNGRFRFCSQTLAAITGHASWRDMIGKHDLEVFPEETARIYYEEELPIFREGKPLLNKVDPYYDQAGNKGWVNTNKWPLLDDEGKVTGLFGISHDVTEARKAEEGLRLAASVFSHAMEGILITDEKANIVVVNDAFVRITGFSREEVIGRTPGILKSGRHDKEFYAALWRDLAGKGHWYGEIWNRRKDGGVYAEMLNISAVRDAAGNIRQYVALFSDITALKEHERELEHIAHYDALTALPNRVLLSDRLHQGMAQAQRRGQRLAVAYIDLDGFKAINDRHGHEAGDQLLMTVAARMKQSLREGDTLARLGGDEFVAVLLDLPDVGGSVPLLTRLLAAAAQPVQANELMLQVSASVGVTFYPQPDDVDADQLLRQADQAMYQAKLGGKNRYHIFDADQDRNVRIHHESLERIRQALSAGEFVLHYQPKIDMREGRAIGVEALIRWQHPEKGLLPPAAFLPVIEDHPLAVDLGEWVIDTALTQIEHWHAAGLDIPVSVNVGARQLQQTDFVERLRALLAAHPQTPAGHFEIEVLETSALEDLAHVSQVIDACREMGVAFALDDFGTGYSSLTYLKRLPVTQLKIDQSFVRDMLHDPEDLAILEGVLGLAAAFRRQAVAEGVETVEHGSLLLQLGCELAQGYVFARPMPAQELPAWLASWRPDPAWMNLPALSRDDLPLLFAGVEHRAWIVALDSHLRDQRGAMPPPLDRHQCHFGKWLDHEGLARHGTQPAFAAIDTLHRQVHALAAELCALKADGRAADALARMDELHALRKRLLEQLNMLTDGTDDRL